MRSILGVITIFISSFTSFGQCDDFSITWESVIYPLCNGDSTGVIDVTTTGGTGITDYTIFPDSFTINSSGFAENLPEGEYTITATDEIGCIVNFTVDIYEPDPLTFVEFGFNPAYCRTSGEQSGNGVVFMSANGGTADFNYLWTELSTGETTNYTTWGGRNAGVYKGTVMDNNGCELTQFLTLDSINPKANFDVISDDLWEIPYGFAGNAPVHIECVNTSEGYKNPNDPSEDTAIYRWHLHNYAEWITTSREYSPSVDFNFENLWGIKLVLKSANGCLDTMHQFFAVFGPLSTEEEVGKSINIIPNNTNQTVKILYSGFDNGVLVRFYSLSGKLLFDNVIYNSEEVLPFDWSMGTYLYEFIDPISEERIGSGKFINE